MNRRHFLATTLASGFAAALAPAAALAQSDDAAARAFVQRISDDVVSMIRNPGGTAAKRAEFVALMDRYTNMRQLAGFSLGRYQRSMPEAMKARYVEAFGRFIAATYVDRFGEYAGETISVGGARRTNDGYLVETTVNGAQSYTVQWDISDRSGEMRVEDFVMEGISMAQSQRSEFTSIIDSYGGDLERFLQFLESRG